MIKDKTKKHYIGFKLSSAEYEKVVKLIKESGLSISRFMLSAPMNKNIIVIPEVKGSQRNSTTSEPI